MTTLGITKELIQGIIATLATTCVIGSMMAKITSMAHGIIDWAIGRWLLGSIVTVVGRMLSTIAGSMARMHLRIMVVISSICFASLSVARPARVSMLFRGTEKDRVIGMGLHVLLEILRALERFATEVTFVRLQGDVDTNVGGDVIPLDSGGSARLPSTREVQVVGALSSDVLLTDMFK